MFQTKKVSVSPCSVSFSALGTINRIVIYDEDKRDAGNLAAERVMEIERLMSAFLPDSDISRIQQKAGHEFVRIHPESFRLLQQAIAFGKLSGGAFDITIRPLMELWGINKKNNYIPQDSEIQELLPLINYRDILLNHADCSVMLKHTGQALDLGGIAKGYAADEVKRLLQDNGVRSAMINLGGNIIAMGMHPEGRPWQIGIQNPLAPTGKYLGTLSVCDQTIVTSGSNERFFIKNGVRYHHLLYPRAGKPARSGLFSVTAICSRSVDADALTTTLFVLGPEQGQPLLKKLNADAVFVTDDLNVAITPGLQGNFQIEDKFIRRDIH